MSKRSKACEIPYAVRKTVLERDNGCCIICSSSNALPNAHFIGRAQGGLGIEQNVVTLCTNLSPAKCHHEYDNGSKRQEIGEKIEAYLRGIYPNWDRESLYYKKY